MKRVFSMVLVLLLLAGMLPIAAQAATTVAITKQPVSVTVASGTTAKVSFTATGDGLTYTWYFKNKGASSFSKTDSFTSNTYSVKMDSSRDGRQVYCVVKDKYGNKVQTNTVTLTMGNPAKITKQPTSVTMASGTTAKVSFTATGDGLTYTWYFKNKGTSSFSKTDSFTSNTYSVKMDSSRDGRQVYCVVKDKYGNSVKTNTVTLTMGNPAKITKQPTSVTVASGTTAKVSFTATGDGLTYTWYFKNKGASSFSKTDSFTSNTYSVKMSSTRDGRQIYCVVKDQYGNSVKTDTVTLSMTAPLTIKTQPKSVTAKEGDTVTFTVEASGGTDPYTYQWQCMDKFDDDYRNIQSSYTWASGEQTATLTMTVREDEFEYGTIYRCVITDANGNTVTSNAVWVMEPLGISIQPQNVCANVGDTVSFTVVASGGTTPYTYQWYSKAQSGQWIESSNTTNTYNFEVNAVTVLQTYSFYCVVTDAEGNTVTSRTAIFSPA